MHEFSLATNILETAIDVANSNKAKKIVEIWIEVGEFTFVNIEQLMFALEIASENTLAKGSQLRIDRIPGRILCKNCRYEGDIKETNDTSLDFLSFLTFECPKCGSNETEITSGRELLVKNIKIAT